MHLLDTLEAGQDVTLDVTAQDESTEGLLRLITEIHEAASDRCVGITLTPVGGQGVRLTLVHPSRDTERR